MEIYYVLLCMIVVPIPFSLCFAKGMKEENLRWDFLGFAVYFCLAGLLGILGEALFS